MIAIREQSIVVSPVRETSKHRCVHHSDVKNNTKCSAKQVLKKSQCGFTLLEIMVSLAILALLAAAITSQSRHSVAAFQRIEAIRAATLMAENAIEKISSQDEFPMIGVQESSADSALGARRIRVKVSSTSHADLRQLDVDVLDAQQRNESVLMTMRAYVGRH